MTSVTDAYVARIGYDGPRVPGLAVLAGVQARHLRAIPFENLDPLLGRGVDISPAAVAEKLLRRRRGGYCFEQNGLLHDVLAEWGFRTTALAARVVWMLPAGAPVPPRTHRLTRVDLPEGSFIVDVGFGGQSPTRPLRLENDQPQATSHGTYRVVAHDPAIELQMQAPDGWCGMYRFTLEPQVQADFELGNWFTSTHPRSRFRQNLIASIIHDGRRYNLLNRQLTIRDQDNGNEERLLASAGELGSLLTEIFDLGLPTEPATLWACLPA